MMYRIPTFFGTITEWLPNYYRELVALFATINVYVFYRLYLAPRFYWKNRGIPHAKYLPLVGSISDVVFRRKPIGEVYADIYNSNGSYRYVGFHKFTQPAILLRDPEIIKKVIVDECLKHFPSNEIHGDEKLDPMFGRHLFALSGDRWQRLRQCVATGFTKDKLREIFDLIPEVCSILNDHVTKKLLDDGANWEVELRELCNNFTTSTMSSCAVGIPCDAINHPHIELRTMGRKLLEPSPKKVLSQLIFLQIPWLAKLLGIPFVPREVTKFFRRTVFEEVTRREKDGIERNDYMQIFIELWKGRMLRPSSDLPRVITPSTKPEDLDDITALALAFFADGHVTTGILLSFALFELAHDKGVQESLRGEVWKAMEDHGGKLTFDALEEMELMDMVLHETLRLYPPAPFMVRSCSEKYTLPDPIEGSGDERSFTLEKGIPVVVPVYGIQRDPQYYPNPDEFNPKRFSAEGRRERKHFTYYPYGSGPRICVGYHLGFLQAKAAIATLLHKFELHPHPRSPRRIKLDPRYFVTVAKGGLWVRFEMRNY